MYKLSVILKDYHKKHISQHVLYLRHLVDRKKDSLDIQFAIRYFVFYKNVELFPLVLKMRMIERLSTCL